MKKIKIKKIKEVGRLIAPPDSIRLKSGYVELKPRQSIGEHVTKAKEEIIIILQGEATVIVEDKASSVKKGHLVYISPNKKHNIRNDSSKNLKYIYITSSIPR